MVRLVAKITYLTVHRCKNTIKRKKVDIILITTILKILRSSKDRNLRSILSVALIDMLHEMNQFHFKDLKISLYGEGNYRLHGKYRIYLIKPAIWMSLPKEERENNFTNFLINRKFPQIGEEKVIKSSYSNFRNPEVNIARKLGQQARQKATKRKNKELRKKIHPAVNFHKKRDQSRPKAPKPKNIKIRAKQFRKKIAPVVSDSGEE